MKIFVFKLALFFLIPSLTLAAKGDKFRMYQHSTSMEIITSNSYARDCFMSASIAAKIFYSSSDEVDNCDFALNFSTLTLKDRAATFTNRGIIYMAVGDYRSAIKDYQAALRLKPDLGEIYVNIGNVYFMGKVFEKAIEEYSVAIEKETSQMHVAYINRAMAYESMGDFDNAEIGYRTAIELAPDYPLPQVRLELLLNKKQAADNTSNT